MEKYERGNLFGIRKNISNLKSKKYIYILRKIKSNEENMLI